MNRAARSCGAKEERGWGFQPRWLLQHAREFLDLVTAGKNDRHGAHVCSSSLSVECPCSWNHRGELQHPRTSRRHSSSISIPTTYRGGTCRRRRADRGAGSGNTRWGQRSSLVTATAATSSPLATATSHPPGSTAWRLPHRLPPLSSLPVLYAPPSPDCFGSLLISPDCRCDWFGYFLN
jgi:hypothetical protein